jgi:hypothetical protein
LKFVLANLELCKDLNFPDNVIKYLVEAILNADQKDLDTYLTNLLLLKEYLTKEQIT